MEERKSDRKILKAMMEFAKSGSNTVVVPANMQGMGIILDQNKNK